MNPFLEACGLTTRWRLIVERTGAPFPEPSPFQQPFLVLGQDPTADLHLDHKDVSERHAFLHWIGGRLHVLDLGSRTGVLYEGRRQRVGYLDAGQSVRVGPFRLVLPADDDAPKAADGAQVPALAFDIKLRGIRPVNARAEGQLALLGSAPDCDVRLLDPAIASYHCAIVNTPCGSWVVDLLAAGGIKVNGEAVRSAPLAEGDTIAVGRSTVRVAAIEWPDDSANVVAPGHHDEAFDTPAERESHRVDAAHEAPVAHQPHRVEAVTETRVDPEPAVELEVHAQPAHADMPPPPPSLPQFRESKLADEPTEEPESTPEPRRAGFFGPWRRTPVSVPNRPAAAVAPAPIPVHVEEREPASLSLGRNDPAPVNPVWEPQAAPASRWNEPAPARSAWSAQSNYDASLPVGPDGSERRGSCRYPVSGRLAQISWSENAPTVQPRGRLDGMPALAYEPGSGGAVTALASGPGAGQTRTLSVSMVDVSHAGLAVLSPAAPPRGERVWFRLDNELTLDWVELVAVGSSAAAGGHQLVRFAFRETCPYDLFKALVFRSSSQRG